MTEHEPVLTGSSEKVERLLDQGRDNRQALLETLDVDLDADEYGEMDDDGKDEVVACLTIAITACLSTDAATSRRILESRHPSLSGMDPANAYMPTPIVRRMATLGLNPLIFVLLGQLGLPAITLEGGPLAGLIMECDAAVRRGSVHELCPTFMLTQDYMWDGSDNDITIVGHQLPDIITGIIHDMPLEDIVSSRLTDGMGLVVWRHDGRFDGLATTLILKEPSYTRLGDIPGILALPPGEWADTGYARWKVLDQAVDGDPRS